MEIIPQKVYTYGDGLPAYKSGEWPGSRPNHFIGSKLILKPIKKFEKDFYICNSRHFPQKYSEEYKFKKSLKSIPPYIHEDIYKPKKRPLKPILTEAKIFIRNRSFNPKDNFCNPNAKEYPLLQKKKKVQNSEQALNEYNIEEIMTRKKRIFSLEQQRNFFKTGKPGDKNYTCVENSPNYFKMEGLVPGSTNRINMRKTQRKGEDNFYHTMDLNIKILNQNKIYVMKELIESLNNDKKYVKELNIWESKVFEDDKDDKKRKIKEI